MSDLFIIHENEEGKVHSTLYCSDRLTIEEVAAKCVEGASQYFTKHRSELSEYIASPFFDALAANFESQTVSIDMVAAREVTRDIIREARKPVLEKLDVEYQRAIETEDKDRMKEVAELKQLLRDLPADPRIEAAKTPEELERLARTAVKEAVGE